MLFITNNVVVLHFAQAYWVTNSFSMNFLKITKTVGYSERSEEAQACLSLLRRCISYQVHDMVIFVSS